MKTWDVAIETVLHTDTQVCAETREEAERIARELLENKECLPNLGDSIGTEIVGIESTYNADDHAEYGEEYEA